MEAEKIGQRLARIWRMIFWIIGFCGLLAIVLGAIEDDIALIAGGLLMVAVAPGSEFISRNQQGKP